MWSVHTRNETTSRRYPPEVHADLPPRTSEASGGRGLLFGGGGGGVGGREEGRGEKQQKGGRKGPARGPQGAPRRSRRLALYGSRIGVGDVGALRLLQCALYSPTLKESHALTSSSSTRRGGPQREESVRERFTRRPPSERSRANEPPGNERPGASRERVLLVK